MHLTRVHADHVSPQSHLYLAENKKHSLNFAERNINIFLQHQNIVPKDKHSFFAKLKNNFFLGFFL